MFVPLGASGAARRAGVRTPTTRTERRLGEADRPALRTERLVVHVPSRISARSVSSSRACQGVGRPMAPVAPRRTRTSTARCAAAGRRARGPGSASGSSVALPLALQAAGRLALVFGRGRSRGPDRVGRRTEFVGRHMADGRGLAGGVRGMPCAPRRSRAAALAWPAAVRASAHVISPRAQARPSSIARRGRSSVGRACSKWCSTCSAQSAAQTASRRWSSSWRVPPRRTVMNRGSRILGRIDESCRLAPGIRAWAPSRPSLSYCGSVPGSRFRPRSPADPRARLQRPGSRRVPRGRRARSAEER